MHNKQPTHLKLLSLIPSTKASGSSQKSLAGCCAALLIVTCSGCFMRSGALSKGAPYNSKLSSSKLTAGQPSANEATASQYSPGRNSPSQNSPSDLSQANPTPVQSKLANAPTHALASYSQAAPASMNEAPIVQYNSGVQYNSNMQAGVIQPAGAMHQRGAVQQTGQHEA